MREDHFRGSHVKDILFGIEDGIVTALGTVLAVSAATSNSSFVVIAGIAALFAEAISMFFGSYISRKSELEVMQRNIEKEKGEIGHEPKKEYREMLLYLKRMGLKISEAERIAPRVMKNKKLLLKIMMREEFGILDHKFESPIKYATIFWVATMVGIFVVIPFLFLPVKSAMYSAVVFSIIILFISGALKTIFTKKNWFVSGLEMAVIGMIAAAVGYAIGSILGVTIA